MPRCNMVLTCAGSCCEFPGSLKPLLRLGGQIVRTWRSDAEDVKFGDGFTINDKGRGRFPERGEAGLT